MYVQKQTKLVMSNGTFGNVPGDASFSNLGVRRNIVAQSVAAEESVVTRADETTVVSTLVDTGSLVTDAFRLTTGSSLASKVLTSDADGNGTWQAVPSPADTSVSVTVANPSAGTISSQSGTLRKYGNVVQLTITVTGTDMQWAGGIDFLTATIPVAYRPVDRIVVGSRTQTGESIGMFLSNFGPQAGMILPQDDPAITPITFLVVSGMWLAA